MPNSGPSLPAAAWFWAGLLALSLAAFLPGFTSLPPQDRDESRFAQASRQMVERGDWIDIRFQDEPRYNKPIGIYWLQAGAATLVGGDPAPIAAFRLPSLLGACAAVLLTAWAGAPLVGRRAAWLGAGLLALCVLLSVEARLAKTDAVLLACAVLAQGALARIRLAPAGGDTRRAAVLFWLAQGLGVLVKGPIVPMLSALTILGCWLIERRLGWLRGLHAGRGMLFALALTLPWLIAIGLRSGGTFFEESLGRDLLAKVGQGQESHGAPPGAYLAAVWLTFFPATLLVGSAVVLARRTWRQPETAFLLAWLVPTWLVFELVATKLLHYVLPTYPALALLAARGWLEGHEPAGWGRWAVSVLWWIPAALLPIAALAVPFWADRTFRADLAVGAIATAILFSIAFRSWWRGRRRALLLSAAAGQLVLVGTVLGLSLPTTRGLWPTERATEAIHATLGCMRPRLAAVGYSEPSLVFRLGTDLALLDPEPAALLLRGDGPTAVLVEQRQRSAFEAALVQHDVPARLLVETRAYGLNRGRWLELALYANPQARCP